MLEEAQVLRRASLLLCVWQPCPQKAGGLGPGRLGCRAHRLPVHLIWAGGAPLTCIVPVSASWAVDHLMAYLSGKWFLKRELKFEVLAQPKLPISGGLLQIVLL